MNIEKYTERARGFIQSAQSLAMREGHQQFSALHLLKVLLDDSEGLAGGLIDRAGGNSRAILKATEDALNKVPKVSGGGAGQVYLAPELARAFDAAEKADEKAGDSFVTVERLLLGLTLEKGSEAGAILSKGGVTPQNLNAAIEALRKGRTADSATAENAYDALKKYARDLTQAAREGKLDPVIGRDEEVRRTSQVLSRRTMNNPVLIGEPGVGKTAIVEGLALRILNGDVPESLKDKYEQHHGVRITDSALVAATTLSNRYITDRFLPDKAIDLMDEAAARLKMQVDSKPEELDSMDREIIRLKIEQEALKKESDAGSKSRLQTLEKELADLEEKSAALTSRWSAEKNKLSSAQRLKAELEALRTELANAQRRGEFQRAGELAYGRIPELEKRLAEIEARENAGETMEEAVTANHIAQVVSRWTGVPVDRMLEGEKEKLLKMEDMLSKRVVGQAEAVHAVATAVRRSRAGLQDPNRPMGSFMFLGPTGVGKTELTKALAEYLFDNEHAMVRLDMSEYMEKHSVSRLIGAPPGYVGYDEGGALTEAVRRRPYQVVLFDEIEKAHPDVFNVLLQVLDDGRLTDGQGRTVDFRNTLIVLTSNLGSEALANLPEGADVGEARESVMEAVRAAFRPEFLNRLDEILLFRRLSRADMTDIVDIQLKRLARLLVDRKIALDIDQAAKVWLAKTGYDPVYGARPLKRVIQRALQNPLAEQILQGRIADGQTVHVGVGE